MPRARFSRRAPRRVSRARARHARRPRRRASAAIHPARRSVASASSRIPGAASARRRRRRGARRRARRRRQPRASTASGTNPSGGGRNDVKILNASFETVAGSAPARTNPDGLEVVLPRRRLKRRVERALGRAFARAFHRHRERVARVAERFQSAPPGLPRSNPRGSSVRASASAPRWRRRARAIDLGVRGGHGDRRDRAVGPDARVLLRVAREALDRGGARGASGALARAELDAELGEARRSHPGRTRTARGRRVRRGGAPRRPSARSQRGLELGEGRGARSGLLGASGSAAIATACASSARSRARAKRCASQLAHRGGSPGGGVAPPEARRADARWEAIVASISSSAAIAGWSDAAAAMRIVEDERRTRSADQEARGMSDRIRIPLERFAPRFRFRSRRGTRRASGKGGALVGAAWGESRRRLATPWGGRGRV